MSLRRTWLLAQKELIHVVRDPRTLVISIIMPVMLLILLAQTMTLDIEAIPLGIYDQSKSQESRALIEAYRAADSFVLDFSPQSQDDLRRLVDSDRIQAGLIIPPDYAADIQANGRAEVALVIDGSSPTVGEQLLAIGTMIGQAHGIRVVQEKLGVAGLELPGIDTRLRIWYNPNMDSIVFMVPALIGMILQMMCSSLTAASIVREREHGTMEQLSIAPIRSGELILGKTFPYMIIAIIDAVEILILGMLWFGLAIHGSWALLIAFCLVFMFTSLAWGLMVSVIAQTRQQAEMMNMALLLPSFMLSGILWPRETLPLILQYLGAVIPLTYFTEMIQGVILKGVGLDVLGVQLGLLATIGIVLMAWAALRFKTTLE